MARHRRAYAVIVLVEAGVLIRYPRDGKPEDEAWLDVVASRHNGELAKVRLASLPVQRTARFATMSEARAFIDELTGSGPWRARIMAHTPAAAHHETLPP